MSSLFTDNNLIIIDSLPIGTPFHWCTPTPPDGCLIRNGQAVSRKDYYELFSVIGTRYGSGDGSTTFNLPNDLGAYERGWNSEATGHDANRDFGSLQEDAIRNITGDVAIGRGTSQVGTFAHKRAFTKISDFPGLFTGGGGTKDSSSGAGGITFDASLVVPTASENRTYNRAYLPVIKARHVAYDLRVEGGNAYTFGGHPSSYWLGLINNKVSNNDVGFTILDSTNSTLPASVSVNSRYVIANPFPEYRVACLPEVFFDNHWCETGWLYTTDTAGLSCGTKATFLTPDSTIIVQTGTACILTWSANTGNGFGANNANINLTSGSCRVLVWKIGRI